MCLCLCLMSINTEAQVSDYELAETYYKNGEYEKALLYLEKLYELNPRGNTYDWYFNSLKMTGKLKEAEKVVKQQLKLAPRDLMLYTDYMELYLAEGNERKATQSFEDLLDALEQNRSMVKRLSDYFVAKQMPEKALEVFKKAKELNGGGYGYEFEVAEIMGAMGNYNEMIAAYLELLRLNPGYLNNVRRALLRTLNFDEEPQYAELIEEEVIRKIQQFPDQLIYNEFLIWLQLQQKDFFGAYIQAKALDLRNQEGGTRINQIAELAYNNNDKKAAVKAFEYLKESKPINQNIIDNAEYYLLKIKKETAIETADTALIADLKSQYGQAFQELKYSPVKVQLAIDYADFLFGQLNLPEQSQQVLEAALSWPNNKVNEAYLKLKLGDLYVAQNNVWEASLLFIQVEKQFKQDLIGHQAKYKNALVHYYTGNFEWAQNQLDVLKASTSKLISNDALDLSLLITDNLALDTITLPMEMFARADLLLAQNNFKVAQMTYDSILTDYPGHSLTDEVFYRHYEIAMKKRNYQQAEQHLKAILAVDENDILADKALFYLAELYANQLNNEQLAKEKYKQVMTDFPSSLYVAEARKKYRALRGDQPTLTP